MSSRNNGGTCYFWGHGHLDAAWLWPFSETMEVFHNTCETILRLMEKYRNFCFCARRNSSFLVFVPMRRSLSLKPRQMATSICNPPSLLQSVVNKVIVYYGIGRTVVRELRLYSPFQDGHYCFVGEICGGQSQH
jgi:hypothetical protein